MDKLTEKLSKVIDFSIDNLGVESLTEISDMMSDLIRQQSFWIKEENEERFHYELKKFLTWLCEYALMNYNKFEKDEDNG